MSSQSGFDLLRFFTQRGVDLVALGAAYLTLLATVALTYGNYLNSLARA